MRRQMMIVLPAVAGLALAIWAFFMRGSGVDFTPGAGLAILGSAAVVAGTAFHTHLLPGAARITLALLILLAAALSTVAGYFLMQPAYTGAMALAFAAALLVFLMPSSNGGVTA